MIGAKDKIDQLLVQKYAMEKVDKPTFTTLVDSSKMLETITDYADMQRNMLALNARLQNICAGINAKSAVYVNRRRVSQPTK